MTVPPRAGLLDLGDHLLVPGIPGGQAQDRHVLVDQGDGTVLHFAGRIAFGMDVGDLLQLQRAFVGDGHIDAPSQVQAVTDVLEREGDLLHFGLRFRVRLARSGIRRRSWTSARRRFSSRCRADRPAGRPACTDPPGER